MQRALVSGGTTWDPPARARTTARGGTRRPAERPSVCARELGFDPIGTGDVSDASLRGRSAVGCDPLD